MMAMIGQEHNNLHAHPHFQPIPLTCYPDTKSEFCLPHFPHFCPFSMSSHIFPSPLPPIPPHFPFSAMMCKRCTRSEWIFAL